MTIYKMARVRTSRDNCIDPAEIYDLTWQDCHDLMFSRTVTEDKDGLVPMFIFASFLGEDAPDYDVACYGEKHPSAGHPIINRKTGNPFVRRCAVNVIDYHCLTLDFDKGITIAEAKQRFRRYRYLAATSHNHLNGCGHRFRMVIPFAEPIPCEAYQILKPEWLNFIGPVDSSTVSAARAFFLPSCPAAMLPLAEAWSNDGDPLDWRPLLDTAIDRIKKEERARKMANLRRAILARDNARSDDAEARVRAKLLDRLKQHYVGYEPTWAKVAIAMVAEGFSEQDFIYISHGLMNSKSDSDCRAKWKAAAPKAASTLLGMGFLWNVTKGHHDNGK